MQAPDVPSHDQHIDHAILFDLNGYHHNQARYCGVAKNAFGLENALVVPPLARLHQQFTSNRPFPGCVVQVVERPQSTGVRAKYVEIDDVDLADAFALRGQVQRKLSQLQAPGQSVALVAPQISRSWACANRPEITVRSAKHAQTARIRVRRSGRLRFIGNGMQEN